MKKMLMGLAALTCLSSIATADTLYVRADGDKRSTLADAKKVFNSNELQLALDALKPGDTLLLGAGTFTIPDKLQTKVSGTETDPIVIRGVSPEKTKLVPKKKYSGRMFSLYHDHYVIENLQLNGGDILFWVFGAHSNIIQNNLFTNAGGECFRMRYKSSLNKIQHNTITNCGVEGFDLSKNSKNGEAIYMGTAPEQQSKNAREFYPRTSNKKGTSEKDTTSFNLVYNNRINTTNECVDLKENSHSNNVVGNICTGNLDGNSGGLGSRGSGNIFRNNVVTDVVGAGIRVGGDSSKDGINNIIINNVFKRTGHAAVKDMRSPQKLVCGNTIAENLKPSQTGLDPAQYCPEGTAKFLASLGLLEPTDIVKPQPEPKEEPKAEEPKKEVEDTAEVTPPKETSATPKGAHTASKSEYVLKVAKVKASSHDGNMPANVLDYNKGTRWSSSEHKGRIIFDLGEVRKVKHLNIAFYKGDERRATFAVDVSVDGKKFTRMVKTRSSGKTDDFQKVDIKDSRVRYVRIVGYGNDSKKASSRKWQSVSDVEIIGRALNSKGR